MADTKLYMVNGHRFRLDERDARRLNAKPYEREAPVTEPDEPDDEPDEDLEDDEPDEDVQEKAQPAPLNKARSARNKRR